MISVQPQSITTTTLTSINATVSEKTSSSPTPLMNTCITYSVLPPIDEPSSSYSSCVKTITSKVNTLSANNLANNAKSTLSTWLRGSYEVCSKSCVAKSSMFPYSCSILSYKSPKYPSRKTNKPWWGRPSSRTCARWKLVSRKRVNSIKGALSKMTLNFFKRFTSRAFK